VAAYPLWDGQVGWKPVKELDLTQGIKNLLNTDPPSSRTETGFQTGYDATFTTPWARRCTCAPATSSSDNPAQISLTPQADAPSGASAFCPLLPAGRCAPNDHSVALNQPEHHLLFFYQCDEKYCELCVLFSQRLGRLEGKFSEQSPLELSIPNPRSQIFSLQNSNLQIKQFG
jgi:hypothetical protein